MEVVGEVIIYKLRGGPFLWSRIWVVSSTFQIVQIIFHTHFDLVSCHLDLEATEPVAETVP